MVSKKSMSSEEVKEYKKQIRELDKRQKEFLNIIVQKGFSKSDYSENPEAIALIKEIKHQTEVAGELLSEIESKYPKDK